MYYCASMATVADRVVRRLRDAGVRTLFGVPGGGSSLELIDAASRAGIPFVLTATETAGAIAASAQAEMTGRPGACLTALGPGASSVMNGVAAAWLDRVPLIVFTDGPASDAQYEHQWLPLAAMFAPTTKNSCRLVADTADAVVAAALDHAVSDQPGPVHIEWPAGLSDTAESSGAWHPTSRTASPESAEFNRMLGAARKPIVIAGLGSRSTDGAQAVRSFCERRGVPVMVTYKAKGVVPDTHPWFAGVFTNAAIEQELLRECDLVIGAGLDPVELLPRPWSVTAPVVYAGRWPVPANHVPFAAQFIGNLADALSIVESASTDTGWSRERVCQSVAGQRQRVSIPAQGLSAQQVVQIAASRLAASARVTVDAGAHMFPATMFWPVDDPNGMLISNGLSTMGFALPAAVGASLLDGDRPVVALTGDGGLLMCLGELVTAVRERLRIIVIVFNDASLSLIEIKQQAKRFAPAGVALPPIDWPALARSFGMTAFAASTDTELEEAVNGAMTCAGPCLIDARIDRSNYAETVRAVRGQI
jgi:acetolactate synthase I/II/III large subunit